MRHGKILVVDDEPAEREGLARLVGQWGYEVETASSGEEALNLIETQHPAVVLTDLVLPEMDGLTLLQKLRETGRPPIVLLVTGHGTVDTAVEAMRHGAFDYLTKPVDATRLQALLEKSIEQESLSREVNFLRHQLRQKGSFGQLVGQSRSMQEVYRWIEIAEMDSNTQAKLLRVLQEGSFRRVGGGKSEIQVDVRVVAATNRVPSDAIQQGQLREDLFYRLNVFSIHLPPLRERKDDIPLLARTFIEEFNRQDNRQVRGLVPDTEKDLERYMWPGNVRELRNVIQRAVVLSGSGLIASEHLPDNVLRGTVPSSGAAAGSVTPIREMERDLILRALDETNQDKRKAAQLLGISLKTLYNKLAKYGIQAVKSARLT